MSNIEIDFTDIIGMGDRISFLERLYKEFAEEDVKNCLYGCKNHECSVRDGIWCDFWNRGYPIKVTKVFLRESDKSVMVGGINMANNKEDEEFFSYIVNFREMKKIVEEVIPSFVYGY